MEGLFLRLQSCSAAHRFLSLDLVDFKREIRKLRRHHFDNMAVYQPYQ